MNFNYEVEYKSPGYNTNSVLIIRGVPGAGKSTLAKHFANDVYFNTANKIFEADQYFMKNGEYKFNSTQLNKAHADCRRRFTEFMDDRENVVGIVSNTGIKNKDIKFYINYAKTNHCSLMILRVDNGFKSVHNVPEEVVARMSNTYQELKID